MIFPGSGFIPIIIYHSFGGVIPGPGTAILAENGNELMTETSQFLLVE